MAFFSAALGAMQAAFSVIATGARVTFKAFSKGFKKLAKERKKSSSEGLSRMRDRAVFQERQKTANLVSDLKPAKLNLFGNKSKHK